MAGCRPAENDWFAAPQATPGAGRRRLDWDRDDCRTLLQEIIPDARRLFAVQSIAEIIVTLIQLGTARQRSDILRQMDGIVKPMAADPVGYVPDRASARRGQAHPMLTAGAAARAVVGSAGDPGRSRANLLCLCLQHLPIEEMAMVFDEIGRDVLELIQTVWGCHVLVTMLHMGEDEWTVRAEPPGAAAGVRGRA